ncbi:hypothetical protein GOP47_0011853, partial [Adiantum capillus-veneris]
EIVGIVSLRRSRNTRPRTRRARGLSKLERESFDTDNKRRVDTLQDPHEQLHDERQNKRRVHTLQHPHGPLQEAEAHENLDVIEAININPSRGEAASALGAAMSTRQNAQRRVWVKTRSQAWWDCCNSPGFPDSEFHQAFRMSRSTFDRLCDELGASVVKEDTTLRQAIPVKQRVAVCIWRLATGDPLRLVSKRFGLGISTCHNLILEVCAAINDVLLRKYVKWPSDEHARFVIDEFEHITGISDIMGSMYTTHIPIVAPKDNAAAYFNRQQTEKYQKTSYSVTLQGVVDASGLFTDLCIGWPGSLSDEQVLEKSALYQRGIAGSLQGVWVMGRSGYPLLDWLLVPYAQHHLTWTQHVFNEKAEEVLKISRNAFSRLKGRWHFLQKRVEVKLQELPAILGACCVLHNICEQYQERYETEPFYQIQDEETRSECIPWSQQSLHKRDQIAHNLLHSVNANNISFL